jgi:hypothetical protein
MAKRVSPGLSLSGAMNFQIDNQGRLLCYPNGLRKPGYVIESDETIRRFKRIYLKSSSIAILFCLIGLAFLWTFMNIVNIIILVSIFCFICLFGFFLSSRFCKRKFSEETVNLEVVFERGSWFRSMQYSAKKMPVFPSLVIIGGAIFFDYIVIISIIKNPENIYIGIVAFLISLFIALYYGFSLYLKLRKT